MPRSPDGTSFEISGTADAPCVVMIHGLGLNKDCWRWMYPELAGQFRILRYDLFGHGASDVPPAPPDLSMFSKQLQSLMDHCNVGSASVIGFSLGGMIARRLAQDCPDRTDALVILHSPHKRSEDAQEAIRARVVQAREEGPLATVEAALERWFTEPYRIANPDVMELVHSWVMANSKTVYHTIYKVLAEGIDEIVAPTPPIDCPTLVITGDEDFGNGPEMSRAIASEIAGAEVLILSGLRHMALAEDPSAINVPVARFLESVSRGIAE